MIISYNWISSYFKNKLPNPKDLCELITMKLCEIESLEEVGQDYAIDIKILPDRAHYALCHEGVAGEIGVLVGEKPIQGVGSELKVIDDNEIDLEVEDKKGCRRYMARSVSNLDIGETPQWVKERLETVGQKLINPIVDATNYVMYECGQPLHAFDKDKVKGKIIIRRGITGEKLETLDGKDVSINENILVIADQIGPLALAGIKGGKRAEVDSNTKNIIIESANFDPVLTRKSSIEVQIRNDSSKRFENEISISRTKVGMDKISTLLQSIYKDAKFGEIIDECFLKEEEINIEVSAKEIQGILGMKVTSESISKVFDLFGWDYDKNENDFIVKVPSDRLDLRIVEDIAEEVGRVIGYENLESYDLKNDHKDIVDASDYIVTSKLKEILSQEGFSETYLYSFSNKGDVEIAYPLSKDKSFLRNNLSQKMSEVLELNSRNGQLLGLKEVLVYEIGKVFTKGEKEELRLCLGTLSLGNKNEKKDLANKFVDISKKITDFFGSSIKLISSGEGIFEYIVLPELFNGGKGNLTSFLSENKYAPISQYPFSVRDVAVFVPEDIEAREIEEIIKATAGSLLVRLDLFDVFEKEIDGKKKKSFAYRFVLQSFEKTLEDDEIKTITDSIYSSFKEKGWEPR